MSTIDVSVILPVAAHEVAIGAGGVSRAVDSVRRQKLQSWELLAIVLTDAEGGGDAPAAAWLNGLAAQDRRIRVLTCPASGGVPGARDQGIGQAQAPSVTYLSPGQELYPDFLASARTWAERGDVLVFACDVREPSADTTAPAKTFTFDPYQHYDRLMTEPAAAAAAVPLGVLHRRHLLERDGQDDEGGKRLWPRLAADGARFVLVPFKSGCAEAPAHARGDNGRARVRPVLPPLPSSVAAEDPVLLPDPQPWDRTLFRRLGLRGLHCGCGTRLQPGWLNTDLGPVPGPGGAPAPLDRLVRLGGHFFYLRHDATRPYPLADGAFDWVYSEHFLEHVPAPSGLAWLKEVRRLLAPGGVARVTTPDLRRYVEGYLDPTRRFFNDHARRLREVGVASAPLRAWMVNQIFYGWGHRCIYDWELLRAAAVEAGFAPDQVRRAAFRQGAVAEMAAMDQAFRSDESIYVELHA